MKMQRKQGTHMDVDQCDVIGPPISEINAHMLNSFC